ncbi:MAG: flagellar assembly protein FliW [Planctomycetota bacterium]
MNVSTSRFGNVEIEDDRIITFPSGLLGFADCRQFALLQPNPEGAFFWLQSIERPELAFVVTDPGLFVTNYDVPLRQEQTEAIELSSVEDAQVLVIANRYGEFITGNLQGPLVVNVKSRLAQQLVLADQRWTTRHKLVATEDHVESSPDESDNGPPASMKLEAEHARQTDSSVSKGVDGLTSRRAASA